MGHQVPGRAEARQGPEETAQGLCGVGGGGVSGHWGYLPRVPGRLALCSLTLPLDLGEPLVPSPEADMTAACGARRGQKAPHAGGPSCPTPPWFPPAPPSPTWRWQSLRDTAAGLTGTIQGLSEQDNYWQCLGSQFPSLIGSGEDVGLAGPGRRPEHRAGMGGRRAVSHACPPRPVWTRPSTFPLLSTMGQAACL